MDLARHRVLVTGGTRGIGLALARRCLAAGARVAVCGRDASRLAELADTDPSITALQVDLGGVGDLAGFVGHLRREWGTPSVLVNNAGVQFNDDWATVEPGQLCRRAESELAINLTAPVCLTALLLADLLHEEEAAVVNVTSLLAFEPKQSAPVYSASKAALRSFTRALRYQMEQHPSLRVVEVVPPMVDTEMTAGRGTAKITADQAATEIMAGLERGYDEVLIGKSRTVRRIHRILPALVAGIMRKS